VARYLIKYEDHFVNRKKRESSLQQMKTVLEGAMYPSGIELKPIHLYLAN
jgi:hypothetical protein